jgi:hypothetical protein
MPGAADAIRDKARSKTAPFGATPPTIALVSAARPAKTVRVITGLSAPGVIRAAIRFPTNRLIRGARVTGDQEVRNFS